MRLKHHTFLLRWTQFLLRLRICSWISQPHGRSGFPFIRLMNYQGYSLPFFFGKGKFWSRKRSLLFISTLFPLIKEMIQFGDGLQVSILEEPLLCSGSLSGLQGYVRCRAAVLNIFKVVGIATCFVSSCVLGARDTQTSRRGVRKHSCSQRAYKYRALCHQLLWWWSGTRVQG